MGLSTGPRSARPEKISRFLPPPNDYARLAYRIGGYRNIIRLYWEASLARWPARFSRACDEKDDRRPNQAMIAPHELAIGRLAVSGARLAASGVGQLLGRAGQSGPADALSCVLGSPDGQVAGRRSFGTIRAMASWAIWGPRAIIRPGRLSRLGCPCPARPVTTRRFSAAWISPPPWVCPQGMGMDAGGHGEAAHPQLYLGHVFCDHISLLDGVPWNCLVASSHQPPSGPTTARSYVENLTYENSYLLPARSSSPEPCLCAAHHGQGQPIPGRWQAHLDFGREHSMEKLERVWQQVRRRLVAGRTSANCGRATSMPPAFGSVATATTLRPALTPTATSRPRPRRSGETSTRSSRSPRRTTFT